MAHGISRIRKPAEARSKRSFIFSVLSRFSTTDNGSGYVAKLFRKALRSEPGCVIDRDMQAVIAHVTALAAPVAGYAMPNPFETREFLDIEMEQFPGPLALIAANGSLRFERGQATDSEPSKPCGHRRAGHRELVGDLLASQAILAP